MVSKTYHKSILHLNLFTLSNGSVDPSLLQRIGKALVQCIGLQGSTLVSSHEKKGNWVNRETKCFYFFGSTLGLFQVSD